MAQITEADTRESIISAAFTCFRTMGLRKTTMVDIAKTAEVSRSTVYEYFRDKESVVEACAESASQRFYRNMVKAIDRDGGSTLEDKLVRAAVFVTQALHVVEHEPYFDTDEVSVMMTKNAATLLQECADFFALYLAAARLTGEVRGDLDVPAASEWFARMLFSLFTTPSPRLAANSDEAVAEFVRPFVVSGFSGFSGEKSRRR